MSFFFFKEFPVHRIYIILFAFASVGALFVRNFYPSRIYIRFLSLTRSLSLSLSLSLACSHCVLRSEFVVVEYGLGWDSRGYLFGGGGVGYCIHCMTAGCSLRISKPVET